MEKPTVTKMRGVFGGDTKNRLMNAADTLFIDHGADAMSLRAVTGLANVNIAAVNYHFGGKDKLLAAVLARRLDPLNVARLRLLDVCDSRWPGDELTCEHVLAAMFVPALRQADEAGTDGLARMRFLGRAYADPSTVTVSFIKQRYESTAARFLDAFARSLPRLPRPDLRLRLAVVLKAVASLIAGGDLPDLMAAFDRGLTSADVRNARLLGSLGSLMAGALMAPPRAEDRMRAFTEVFELANVASTISNGPAAKTLTLAETTKGANAAE